jgi:ribosomal protein S18 acetylase RimI-like enzyme
MSELPLVIREYRPVSDADFIYSTWIKSFAESNRSVPKPIYNLSQRSRINKILEDQTSYVLVACPEDTEELIYGYLVGTATNVIHYMYCKMDYRQQGVGKKLLEHLDMNEPILYTHKPNDIWITCKLKEDSKLSNWLYDPYFFEREY